MPQSSAVLPPRTPNPPPASGNPASTSGLPSWVRWLGQRPVGRRRHARGPLRAPGENHGGRRQRDQPDPRQLGLPRLRRGPGRSGAAGDLRRHHQHGRRHGYRAACRRYRTRVDRHERPAAVHPDGAPARGRPAPRRALDQGHRHLEPERLQLPLRRQPHVLPPGAAGPAPGAHRPHRLLPVPRARRDPARAATRRRERGAGGGAARVGSGRSWPSSRSCG